MIRLPPISAYRGAIMDSALEAAITDTRAIGFHPIAPAHAIIDKVLYRAVYQGVQSLIGRRVYPPLSRPAITDTIARRV